jgi:hypothetical protein
MKNSFFGEYPHKLIISLGGSKMRIFIVLVVSLGFAISAYAADGYKVTGHQGVMHFVQIDKDKASNTDNYRLAVADICRTDKICQVLFWTDNAPSKFPLTDAQVNSKAAHWQINMNTGLRRWFWDCDLVGEQTGDECL